MGRGSGTQTALVRPLRPPRALLRDLPNAALPETHPDEDWFQPDPAVVLEAKQVAQELDYDEIIATRLVTLGYSAQEITDYLNPSPKHLIHPEQTVPGISAAARELLAAIDRGEGIAIYADYDVDGQTSLAIVAEELRRRGIEPHIGSANQRSGFGLSRSYVEEAHAAGSKWLITVDCGSTQTEPVRLAQSLGMQVIVIDHHDVELDNTAEHHLNPRLFAARAFHELSEALAAATEGMARAQSLDPRKPYTDQLDGLSDRSRQRLIDHFEEESYLTGQSGEERLAELEQTVRRPLSNTGAMLSWKFVAAMQIEEQGHTSDEHYGRALYLAGLGAIADLAPCSDMEVRACVRASTDEQQQRERFGNTDVIPLGVKMVAEALGENPSRPDQLTRTRALLNMPKRTTEIEPEKIHVILTSRDEDELKELVGKVVPDYERISALRREQMDPIVVRQLEESEARGEESYFSYAVVEGYEQYAGFSRMGANTATKVSGKPAVVFVRKTTGEDDEFGQELYKWSGANDCVPEAHLGDMLGRDDLRDACKVRMRDWVGEESEIPSLGGHTEVISGVCTRDQIPAVQRACEQWAREKDEKRLWRPVTAKRPRVARRLVKPHAFRRLEREAPLLAPISFPESPAVQVSVQGQFERLRGKDHNYTATLRLEDGTDRQVYLSPEVAATVRSNPRREFEVVVALGGVGPYYISTIADGPA